MVKILEKEYPMGSYPKQRKAGRYINQFLYDNLKILAKNITKDITYLGICSSSTYEVGAGKSTFISQIGEAYTMLVNEYHHLNLTFDMNNCVFKPKDLIERSFKLPQYSFIMLDEWEDAHYWSELGMTLRQFFRKCRQLNLFIFIIVPNFFQLPINYAVSRSLFFVDVKFEKDFERGHFSFYNFDRKKYLYLYGKKNQDYGITSPNFSGRFVNGYAFDEQEYRAAKKRDLIEAEDGVDLRQRGRYLQAVKITCIILHRSLKLNAAKIARVMTEYGLEIAERTAQEHIKEFYDTHPNETRPL